MVVVLPFLYTVLFLWLIFKWNWLKRATISINFIATVFSVKVILSVLYTYLHIRLYGGADVAGYYSDGMIIYKTLVENPLKFLMLTFGPNNLDHIPLFISNEVEAMGYWGDSSSYSIVRFYALSNLLSNGNIYVAGVLMSFISTIGLLLLHKALTIISQSLSNNIITKLIVFGLPSTMFWSSGAHKEGLIITGLGCFFYSIAAAIVEQKKYNARTFLLAFISGWLIWYVRDFVLYLLIPGLIAYIISKSSRTQRAYIAFAVTYVLFIIAGFVLQFNIKNENLNFLQAIQLKNSQFQEHTDGNTNIEIPAIEPDFKKIILNIPSALSRVVGAPFYIKNIKIFHWVFIVENILILLFLSYSFYQIAQYGFQVNAFFIWQLLFAITMLVLIGLVVSNVGAIIRYRSIILPFLLLPVYGFIKQSSELK